MSDRVLALFAKAPIAGQVKTRLSPPLSPDEAAGLYEAMLLDILDQHAEPGPIDLALWYTPAEAMDWFRRAAPPGYRLYPQAGSGLSQRMGHLFRVHAKQGYDRIVLRGTDSPTLPQGRVEGAFEALDRYGLVLCPDRDGGYNLIGARGAADALFDLEMSTPGVLDQTLAKAKAEGLRVHLLPPHHDVDTAADLGLIRNEMTLASTPRTLRYLARLRVSIGP